MKSYLITGGCGFVGSNIASRLIDRGEKVILLDNLSRVGSSDNLQWLRTLGSPEFIQADTADAAAVSKTVNGSRPDVVFHLAGQVAMTTSMKDPFGDFRTNVLGTMNLLEALRLHSPESALLYSSSNKVYGSLAGVRLMEGGTRYTAPDHPQGVDESTPLDFRTPYGCSKGAADQYVLEYARTYGLRTAVFRHSTIYGGRQHSTYDQGWVGWFCMQALVQKENPSSEPFTISGDGKQVRDLLNVEDAVSCYLEAARQIERIKGEAFNIGGGMSNSCSLLELFGLLEGMLGINLRFTKLDWRHEDQRFFVADNSKIEAATGWMPQVARKEGVDKTLEWVMNSREKIK
jgi:CDP-paratose 2-epimerase